MTFIDRLAQRIPERLRKKRIVVDAVAWNGAAIALRITGWLLVVTAVLQLALPQFAWERALGVGAGIGMAILAAVLVLFLCACSPRPARFWWGALLTTAILAVTFGLMVSPKGSRQRSLQ